MTRYGTWVSYSGSARLILAIVLLAAAGGLVCAAIRLRRPVRVPRPGQALAAFMVLAWGLAGVAFLACLAAYVSKEELSEHIAKPPPADPITPVTATAAVVLFLVVYIATPYGRWTRISSAAIAAMAAAAIFELPFDLIIWTRVYPPAPDPALYRALFFAPLVLVELTTLSLLTMSPMVKLSRTALFCLALMLLVFAVWALAGFGYPSAPFPFAMNVVSKILAFVTALSLYRPDWFTWRRQSRSDGGLEQAAEIASAS